MVERYKRKPNTKCFVCDKSIYRRPFEIEKTKGKVFCSLSCHGISSRKEVRCKVCDKVILSRLNKETCSRGCANKSREGIKYKINQPKNKALISKGIKMKLLKDRGEKCERCSYNKEEILQIHHKNRNRDDNSLKNLELLCPNCHYEEHYL